MTREQEILRQGIQAHTDAGAIGGGGSYIDDRGRPTVILGVSPNGTNGEDFDLHQGDTFPLGDEVWEVTEIRNADASFWATTLTRVG